MICQFCFADISDTGPGHKPWCPIPSPTPDDVRWSYPAGRSIALRAWEKSACTRCQQVVDAIERHRCTPAAARLRQVGA